MLSCCIIRTLLLLFLLELISILSTRPQLPRYPGSSHAFYNKMIYQHSKRSTVKPIIFEEREDNITKERILNANNRGTISFGQYSEQEIIFPDSPEINFNPTPPVNYTPKCAEGSTYCETFDSYPYLHLQDILQRQEVDKQYFFGKDEVPIELEKRIGIDEETFLCTGISKMVFPQIGKNKNNEWKYIVNQGQGERYVQGVRIETCRSEGQSCNIIGELPQGYRTTCKQKYVYRRLLSLNDDGAFIPDTFQLPSSCCCSYETDIVARIGLPPKR